MCWTNPDVETKLAVQLSDVSHAAHRAAYAAPQLPFLEPREKNSWLAEQRSKSRLSKRSCVTEIALLETAWCMALV